MPLYQNTVQFSEASQITNEDFISEEEIGKYIKFKNFFKRYNKIQLDSIAIKKEREKETQINQDLKTQLLKYMDGMTVTKFVLDNKENTLLRTQEKPLFRNKVKNDATFIEGQHDIQKIYQYVKN